MIGRTNADWSGGGVFSDEVTANKSHVLSGKTYLGVDTDDEIGTGTMPNRGVVTPSLGVNGTYEIKEGYYAPGSKVTQSIANNGAINGTLNCGQSKSIPAGYTTGGTVSANSLSSQTSGTAAASSILSGKTAWVNGSKVTGTIASMTGGTKTPTTSQQTVSCSGKYMTSNIIIPGFSLPSASSLLAGTTYTLYGKSVTGTAQQYVSSPSSVFDGTGWGSGLSSGLSSNTSANIMPGTNGGSNQYNINGVSNAYIRTNCAVNLTGYKYLKAVVSSSKYYDEWFQFYLCVSTSANYSGYTATSAKSADSKSKNTIICDVTNLNGMYYIYFHCVSPGGGFAVGTIYSITLSNS